MMYYIFNTNKTLLVFFCCITKVNNLIIILSVLLKYFIKYFIKYEWKAMSIG